MNLYLMLAAIMSLLTGLAHIFLGGPAIAGPLLQSNDMHAVSRYTNYYCWHIVSIVLIAMPAGFAWAAFKPSGIDLAVLMTLLAASFMIWNVVLIVWKKQHPWQMPQWALFLPVTLLGALGVFL